MSSKFSEISHSICSAGIVLNTVFFGFNLLSKNEDVALLNFLCCLIFWVGIYANRKKEDVERKRD
tara:strand:+ start:613 stop:807 length:195 start_codon:yes stop_codon:yes gene_type:complete